MRKDTVKEAHGDFPGGPGAEAPHSQCRGPRFPLWSGDQTPRATNGCSRATMKLRDPTCRNKDLEPPNIEVNEGGAPQGHLGLERPQALSFVC